MMDNIKGLSLKELEAVLKKWQKPAFHARQMFSWIYQKNATDFNAMSDLPSDLRRKLKENFYLSDLKLIRRQESRDSTEKFLFGLKDGGLIEAVSIPAEGRVTGCISTQVGCRFKCSFCASGMAGFKKDLSCAEMLDEVLYLKNNSSSKRLTHLVFMGTGEHLDN